MKMRLATMAVAGLMAASPVMADLMFPSLSYRTGPYAAGGIPFADGYADYFTLLNERDGGIGGVMTQVPECETGYNTEKGVECYEALKENALVFEPLSTGITYQLIPKTTADDIPMHTTGYGRTSAKNGAVFTHTFNYPANYWDGASGAINYLLAENGGDINGKKISLVYHNSAYGKEPIRTLQELSKKHGFELTEVPVDHPGQEQKSQWLQIRRDKPDYVIMWG
ncbi:MAG: ABC transporter substrate-binding protein, partial [Sulfitobacter sp.]